MRAFQRFLTAACALLLAAALFGVSIATASLPEIALAIVREAVGRPRLSPR